MNFVENCCECLVLKVSKTACHYYYYYFGGGDLLLLCRIVRQCTAFPGATKAARIKIGQTLRISDIFR